MLTKSSINRRLMAGIASPYSLILAFAFTIGCATADNQVTIRNALGITEDRPYYQNYKKANRQFEVVQNFKTRQQVSATLLTSGFRQAVADRHKALFMEAQPVLGEASNQTGFFLTVFIPDAAQADLRNERLWNVMLKTSAGNLKPTLIKRLSEKKQWTAFFPRVNLWTEEYLILFAGSTAVSNEQLVKKDSITLSLANKDATILLDW